MKVCWDNLEYLKYVGNNCWRRINTGNYFVYKESCDFCGNFYLTAKDQPSDFCCVSCSKSGKNNPFYGKQFSDEHRKKISIANKGKLSGKKNPRFGKPSSFLGRKHSYEGKCKISKAQRGNTHRLRKCHSEESRRKMSEACKGRVVSVETRRKLSQKNKGKVMSIESKRKISKANTGRFIGEKGPNWKGGISKEPYCFDWTKDLKEYIKQRDGYKCVNPCCSSRDLNDLTVHHVDYNKKVCWRENLITLCRSCNSKANFNREWHKNWYQKILNRRYNYGEGGI